MVRVAILISAMALFSGPASATSGVNSNNSKWNSPAQSTNSTGGYSGYGSSNGSHSSASQGMQNGYATPSMYGSGSAPWAGSNYNDCINQCIARYGSSPSPYVPTPTMNTPSGTGSSGTGATHTVIVAPSQGVLRYVPFALNASAGDTVNFLWGANTHTVTKSSSLSPCNATHDSPFASGVQRKGFVFTQVVNDTNPMFFYCGVPTHCSKGMFGVINPPNASSANMSVSGMMDSMMANNSNLSAYASIVNNATNSTDSRSVMATTWGESINMASFPPWAYTLVAENVLYTRNFLAINLDLMKPDGTADLSALRKNPMIVPLDVTAVLAQADSAMNSSSSTPVATTPFAASSTASSTIATASVIVSSATVSPSALSTSSMSMPYNGAIATSSSQFVVGLLAVLATFLPLL